MALALGKPQIALLTHAWATLADLNALAAQEPAARSAAIKAGLASVKVKAAGQRLPGAATVETFAASVRAALEPPPPPLADAEPADAEPDAEPDAGPADAEPAGAEGEGGSDDSSSDLGESDDEDVEMMAAAVAGDDASDDDGD